MLLVDYARQKGATMLGLHGGKHIGTTANEALAMALREAGMSVMQCYGKIGPNGYSKSEAQGPLWELSCLVGAQARPEAQAA